mmetsp:Transcript_107940/g.247475  ORF Transcript_107940/g.247475 Transcript_107940/m.247475 type:complete len:208 (-) Transcript_107940:3568-4191(-)
MQAKDQRRIHRGQPADVVAVVGHLPTVRDTVAELGLDSAKSETGLVHVVAEPEGGIGVEELPVQRVLHAPAILNRGNHDLNCLPAQRQPHSHGSTQVLLKKYQRGLEVRTVEFIGDAPPDRAELSPFLHDRMQEGLHKNQGPPLLVVDLVQQLLGDRGGVRAVQAGLEPHGGLQGHLDGHLEESDREPRGNLTRDPQPEGLVNLRGL